MKKFQINVTREQWIEVAKIVLAAILAVCAVFGYDLGVIQPREALMSLSGMASRALGSTTRITSNLWLQNSGMTIDKTLDVTGVSTLSGGMVGDVTGNLTGNVTGNVSGSTTGAVITATTRITTPLLTVNGVATVGSLSAGAITSTGQITGASLTVNGAATIGGAASAGSFSTAGDGSFRAVTATGQITGASLTINGAASSGSFSTLGDVSTRNVTATGGISIATVSTFNQAVNAYGGIDTNGTSVVLDGDGHSWIAAPVQDQIELITGSGYRALFTDAGALVTGTLGVSDVASAPGVSATGGITASGHMTTNKLYIGAVPFSGPVVGISQGVASNVAVSHTLSSAPTYIACTVQQNEVFTYTLTISDTDDANVWFGMWDPVSNEEIVAGSYSVTCIMIP